MVPTVIYSKQDIEMAYHSAYVSKNLFRTSAGSLSFSFSQQVFAIERELTIPPQYPIALLYMPLPSKQDIEMAYHSANVKKNCIVICTGSSTRTLLQIRATSNAQEIPFKYPRAFELIPLPTKYDNETVI